MLDSAACGGCHREQYEEWRGSMHAYAADDPVFRALNTVMQREVPPEQQTFCLKCHAPMAVRLGRPTDFASLDADPKLKGVTCYFCHAVDTTDGSNNNPLVLGDGTMRAGIKDPIDPKFHRAEYSLRFDGERDGQPALCGPCHDIVTVQGAHIERTFKEWGASRFGIGEQKKTPCGGCHMKGRDAPASVVPDSPVRRVHDHRMVGVDLALTTFPDKDDQRKRVQAFLDDAVDARLCVNQDASGTSANIEVTLTTELVGHAWPSGSNQDRRAWIELTAYRGDAVIFESGHVPEGVAVEAARDANLFLLRDRDFDSAGQETEFFWRTARFESSQLPPKLTSNPERPGYDNGVHVNYPVPSVPDRVAMAVRLRAIDFDLIEALEKEGALDRRSFDPLTTFTLGKTKIEWASSSGTPCTP